MQMQTSTGATGITPYSNLKDGEEAELTIYRNENGYFPAFVEFAPATAQPGRYSSLRRCLANRFFQPGYNHCA
jgi:hypothetical protein